MNLKHVKYIVYFNTAAVLRNLTGVIRAKFVSIVLGVEHVGILGQIITFYNFQSNIIDFGVFSLIVHQLSGKISIKEETHETVPILRFSLYVLIVSNLLFVSFFLCFASYFSTLLFGSERFQGLLLLLIGLGPVYSLSYLLENLVRAKKQFKALALGQNLAAIFGVLSIVPLVWAFGMTGVIYNLYFYWIVSFIIFFTHLKSEWHLLFKKKANIKKDQFLKFLELCSIYIARKVLAFSSLVVFRTIIVQLGGLNVNGFFQSVWSITQYVNIVIMAFAVYLFPTLSSAKNNFREVLNDNLRFLLNIIYPIVALIMAFPDLFLILFYNTEFVKMKHALNLFLFLKFFDAVYIFYLFVLISSDQFKKFLALEGIKSVVLVVSSYLLVNRFQLNGAIFSYAFTQGVAIVSLLIIILSSSSISISKRNFRLMGRLALGLLILVYPLQHPHYLKYFQLMGFVLYTFLLTDIVQYYRKFLPKMNKN